MKPQKFITYALGAFVMLLTSCTDNKGWTVEGTIAGGAGQKVALQAFNNNHWYTVDSITVSASGHFEYKSATPAAFPEVLRLSANGASIYFPVDSVSRISIDANIDNFATDYKLTGTEAALKFAEIDSLINATVAMKGEKTAATDSLLKRQLTQIVLTADEPIAGYYIINKRIGNKPLFDPASKRDLSIIGAVAQSFDTHMPSDPRTTTLRNMFLSAKAAANPERIETNTIEIEESGLSADIAAFDNKGTRHTLYDEASKGKVLLLSFTNYELESSPAYNVILADIYKKYHNNGLEIFQLAFDGNEAEWKQSAVNLPWITLWNAPEDGSAALINYNVNVLPLTYIIDRTGVIRSRVTDPNKLNAEIAKYI